MAGVQIRCPEPQQEDRPVDPLLLQVNAPIVDLRSATWKSDSDYELRPDAKRFENWEDNYAAKLGFGAAVDYALDIGLENIKARIDELAGYLRAKLSELDTVKLHTITCAQIMCSLSRRGRSTWRSPAT